MDAPAPLLRNAVAVDRFLREISLSIGLHTLLRLQNGAPLYECKKSFAPGEPPIDNLSAFNAFRAEFSHVVRMHLKYIVVVFPGFGMGKNHLKNLSQTVWGVCGRIESIRVLTIKACLLAAKSQPQGRSGHGVSCLGNIYVEIWLLDSDRARVLSWGTSFERDNQKAREVAIKERTALSPADPDSEKQEA
ncbi:hypothetical protein AURDEDRAFT_125911 [Auricularia subglabra TFB-10046 SS5]|nr:hypothetical protein AURDEDRAFT_125911 [Auricularia subglabra TFB-10046 SS5]